MRLVAPFPGSVALDLRQLPTHRGQVRPSREGAGILSLELVEGLPEEQVLDLRESEGLSVCKRRWPSSTGEKRSLEIMNEELEADLRVHGCLRLVAAPDGTDRHDHTEKDALPINVFYGELSGLLVGHQGSGVLDEEGGVFRAQSVAAISGRDFAKSTNIIN